MMNSINSKSLKSFEVLDCWNACRDVRRYVAKLVKKYPAEERYIIVDDMLRAARSTSHNIAEGFGRFHYQENIQFCRQSRGSLYELKDQFICSIDEDFITNDDYKKGMELTDKATALLNGYINYLRKRKSTNNK